MIIQVVKLKTHLDQDVLMERAKEREPQFRAIQGLLQKYYVKLDEPDLYGGVYVWDSVESLQSFRESPLAASIPAAYEVVQPPEVEIMDVLFQLRN